MIAASKNKSKEVIRLAVPAIVESLSGSVAGLIDAYMVSSIGSVAVASVSLACIPIPFALCLFTAINIAVSVIVARRTGENDMKRANSCLITALTLVVAASIIMGIIFVTMPSQIMRLCGSNADSHEGATQYVSIVMGCMLFNCVKLVINSAWRGAGETKISMKTNLVSNVVNIVFNYLLIGGKFGFPAMGIRGAAIATVLGHAVSCAMCVASLFNMRGFLNIVYIWNNKIKPNVADIKAMKSLGISVFLEQFFHTGGMMIAGVMLAGAGTLALAVSQIVTQILGFTTTIFDGIRTAAVALVGISLGEKSEDAAFEYASLCHKFGLAVASVFAIISFVFAEEILSMFFSEPQYLSLGKNVLWIAAVVMIFSSQQLILLGSLHGAGDTGFTAALVSVTTYVARIGIGAVLCYVLNWGIYGIWCGITANEIILSVAAYIRLKSRKWIKKVV